MAVSPCSLLMLALSTFCASTGNEPCVAGTKKNTCPSSFLQSKSPVLRKLAENFETLENSKDSAEETKGENQKELERRSDKDGIFDIGEDDDDSDEEDEDEDYEQDETAVSLTENDRQGNRDVCLMFCGKRKVGKCLGAAGCAGSRKNPAGSGVYAKNHRFPLMSMCIMNRRGKCHVNVGRGCSITSDEDLTAWCVSKNKMCPDNGVNCPREDLKIADPTPHPTPQPGMEKPCQESCSQEFANCMGWHGRSKTPEQAYSQCRSEIDAGKGRLAKAGCTPWCVSTQTMCAGHKGCSFTTAEPDVSTTAEPETSTTTEPAASTTVEPDAFTTPHPTTQPGVEKPCQESCSQEFANCMGWHGRSKTPEQAYSQCRREIDAGKGRLAKAGCTPWCVSTQTMCAGHEGCSFTTAEPDASTTAEPETSTTAEPAASTTAEPDAFATAEPETATTAEPQAPTKAPTKVFTTTTLMVTEAYYKLGNGEASCPEGADVLTAEECKSAAAALGIWHDHSKYWSGQNGGIPRYCSMSTHAYLHFAGARSGGRGRRDLAPLCKTTAATRTTTTMGAEHATMSSKDGFKETGEDHSSKDGFKETGEVVSPDCCNALHCLAFGDPHFITFDGVNLQGFTNSHGWEGRALTYWLVKSDTVQIQGRSWGRRGVSTGFGVTGDWLHGHTLMLERERELGHIRVTWDGTNIFGKGIDDFEELGLVSAKRGTQLITAEHLKDLGEEHSKWMENEFKGTMYIFTLPRHVQIFVDAASRWNGVGILVKIGGCGRVTSGFEGWCGPTTQQGEGAGIMWRPSLRFVEANEDIWHEKNSLAEVDTDGSPTSESEDGSLTSDPEVCTGNVTKKEAEKACEHVIDSFLKSECIFDVCILGDVNAARDVLGAQLLEVEDWRAEPFFVGNGRCLDYTGNQYTAFKRANIITTDGCKSALKQLVAVTGVRGAQLHKGYGCEILVDPDTAISTWAKPGKKEGKALVAGVDKEKNYTCWRLN